MIRSKYQEFETWKKTKVINYVRTLSNWEVAKRTFSGKEAKGVEVAFATAIMKALFGSSETTSFTVAEFSAFFDPVLNEVMKLIDAQLEAVPTINSIFLVGGFSCSMTGMT